MITINEIKNNTLSLIVDFEKEIKDYFEIVDFNGFVENLRVEQGDLVFNMNINDVDFTINNQGDLIYFQKNNDINFEINELTGEIKMIINDNNI